MRAHPTLGLAVLLGLAVVLGFSAAGPGLALRDAEAHPLVPDAGPGARVPVSLSPRAAPSGLTSAQDPVEASRSTASPARLARSSSVARVTLAASGRLRTGYGAMPLRFEANQGQTDGAVQFLSRGGGHALFLKPTEAVLVLAPPPIRPELRPLRSRAGEEGNGAVLRLKLLGASPHPRATGLEELPGKANYFIGNDPAKWRRSIPTYARVKFEGVYPGVDLVYYGNDRRLEYDFVVAPGADPKAIAITFEGADTIETDARGDLVLRVAGTTIRQRRPLVYQEIAGVRREIPGSYVLEPGRRIGFRVAAYDATRPLIIDPVLAYSTYLDGQGYAIKVDGAGQAYVTGRIESPDLPAGAGVFQPDLGGGSDAFVAKLNPAGTAFVYATYLGGAGFDAGTSIAIDGSGSAYVAGVAGSGDFPTTPGALQEACGGRFVTKLNAAGSDLVYSTCLGAAQDFDVRLAVDASGHALVIGHTDAGEFTATAGAYQATHGGSQDAFVAKLTPGGDGRVYFTFLGGPGLDSPRHIAVDADGNAYVTGGAEDGFPTTPGAFRESGGGAFAAKLDPTGSALFYSTFLGGGLSGYDIVADADGNAYIAGDTTGAFPTTPGAFQTTFAGTSSAFVAKLDPTGSSLVFSTFLRGGSGGSAPDGLALDADRNVYVGGVLTSVPDFPTTIDAFQASPAGGLYDGFIAKLNAAGTRLLYATYLGGSGESNFVGCGCGFGGGLAVDGAGSIYVTGRTDSEDFPTTPGAIQTTFLGQSGYVAKIPLGPALTGVSIGSAPVGATVTITLTGFRLDQLNFGEDTISFGPGISVVPGSIVVGPDGTTIALQIRIDGDAGIGARDVTITDNPGGNQIVLNGKLNVVPQGSAWRFLPGSGLQVRRLGHTATALPNGTVLVAGGFAPEDATNTAEIFDPTTGLSSATANAMSTARGGHVAITLADGRVLVAGGRTTSFGTTAIATADIFDPATGLWTPTGSLGTARSGFAAALLASGRVLVTGGRTDASPALSSAEIFDPAAGAFSPTGTMAAPRRDHTATLLPTGNVLIAGGVGLGGADLDSAERFDESGGGSFSAIASPMVGARSSHQAVRLPSGNVLLAGATSGPAELYDTAINSFIATGTPAVPDRRAAGVALLPSGRVLFVGGDGDAPMIWAATLSAEVYDPASGLFSLTDSPFYGRGGSGLRFGVPLVRLDGLATADRGKVIVVGGDSNCCQSTVEMYRHDPVRAYIVHRPVSLDAVRTLDIPSGILGPVPGLYFREDDLLSAIAVHPSGSPVYATHRPAAGIGLVRVIYSADASTSIQVGRGPSAVAVNPAGTRVYVANELDNSVSVIDAATNHVIRTVSGIQKPAGIAVSPDGGTIYVTDGTVTGAGGASGRVFAVDAATYGIAPITLPSVPAFQGPTGIAISPDGKRLYVASGNGVPVSSQTLWVVKRDLADAVSAVSLVVHNPDRPSAVAVTPDGRRVYITNTYDNVVTVYDTVTESVGSVTATPPVAEGAINIPVGVDISPDGQRLYIVNEGVSGAGSASAGHTADSKVFENISIPDFPGAYGRFIGVSASTPLRTSDLFLDVQVSTPGPIAPGTAITYTFTVYNNGPDAAPSVGLYPEIPGTFTSFSFEYGNWVVCAYNPGVFPFVPACNLGTVPAGGSKSLAMTLTYTSAGVKNVTATATGLTGDPYSPDNTAVSSITVQAPAGSGTTSFAQSVPQIIAPTASATLGNIEIDEHGAGVLSAAGRIQITLPVGLTFAGSPAVSTLVSNGLTVGSPAIEACAPGCTFSFAVTQASTTGAGRILVSGISVVVPGGFPLGPISVALAQQPSGGGLTAVGSLQVATAIPSPSGPALTGVSINAVGEGVTTTVTLTGQNFNLLNLSGVCTTDNPCDTISFGAGITVVPGSIVVSADGKAITLQIHVAGDAALGARDVVIADNPGSTIALSARFSVNAPPTVTGAGTADGTAPLLSPFTGEVLKGQTVVINGTGFQAPTTVPSNLRAEFSGTGITVRGVAYSSGTQISVTVDVAAGAELVSPRDVTVTNPDLGVGVRVGALAVTKPAQARPEEGTAPKATQGTATPPANAPTLTNLVPASAVLGTTVRLSGSKFSAVAANNLVTFTGPNGIRVPAKVLTSPTPTTSALSVQVPATAVDGPVRIAVSGVSQAASATPINFTVTNPTLATVAVAGGPASGKRGHAVLVELTGSKFMNGSTVSLTPATGVTVSSVEVIDATLIRLTATVGPAAPLGLRDVTVTNPGTTPASSTLAKAFEVKLDSAVEVTFSLTRVQGGEPLNVVDFLPSVDAVQVTLDATGKCVGRQITPTVYLLQASVPSGTPPPSLRFTLTSPPPLPGTATNDDCEPNLAAAPPLPAESDFSIGRVGDNPNAGTQEVTAPHSGGGIYHVWLASWDWGGSVRIDVVDDPAAPAVAAGLSLPVDTDGDGLPDAYERDAELNADRNGANVLDRVKGGQGGTAKFAADGLTNFEKYRGVYRMAPAKGSTGQMSAYTRLGSGKRNLFVRGQGFATDPALPAGMCGLNSGTVPPTPIPADPAMPCPVFQVGGAFSEIGVQIWDVSAAFSAGGTTVFPTRSLANPSKPMLDLATVTYDAANCIGGAQCDHTSKLGPRQWNFPTLAFSTFGGASTYGSALVLARPLKAYFLDRPYLHQDNLDGKFLPVPTDGPTAGKPMLAPPTIVCDKAPGGSDDGTLQSGECLAPSGALGGDVYRPGVFNLDSTAMDVNNDGCVELPFVGDPTTLRPCGQSSSPSLEFSASAPQATFQQVVRHLITHELGHAVGVNAHFTTEVTDLMYASSINWMRDGHLSGALAAPFTDAAKLVQIHNKGLQ